MPIYMNYDGIDGDVSAAGHEKWIELLSCQMGVNRHITSPSGKGTNREATTPAVQEIVVTKLTDAASTNLFRAALFGEGKLVKIDFCKTDKDKAEPYLQLELENTLVSNFNCSGSGGGGQTQPMESLALNFTKITFNNIGMGTANETGQPDRAEWNLAELKGS